MAAGVLDQPLTEEEVIEIGNQKGYVLQNLIKEILAQLRRQGCRVWLLSNAQRAFTEYELRYLGLLDAFDGIYISSDHMCRKPDRRFFDALIYGEDLDRKKCIMIGNDRDTDIKGARSAGLDTLYIHTALTPQE